MNTRLEQINPIPILVAIIGCAFAVYLGTVAGGGQYSTLTKLLGAIGVVSYVLYFYRFSWHVAVFFIFSGLVLYPAGFRIDSGNLTLVFFFMFIGTVWWRKTPFLSLPLQQTNLFRLTYIVFTLWLLYLIGHATFNTISPHRIEDFSFRTNLRIYTPQIAVAFLFLYFTKRPGLLNVNSNFVNIIGAILLTSIAFNIFLKLTFDFDSSLARKDEDSYFYIPGIQATASPYTLRSISYYGALIGIIFCSRAYYQHTRHPRLTWLLFFSLTILSLIGAIASTGRATLALSLILITLGGLILKQHAKTFVMLSTSIIFVLLINLVYPFISTSQHPFERSLQWILFQKNEEVYYTISGSGSWREDLRNRAYEIWRSEPRIFWFGRAAYAYTDIDVQGAVNKDPEALIQTGLRNGATHTTHSSFSILFGLIGTTLFYTCFCLLGLLFWKIARMSINKDITAYLFAMASCVLMGINFCISFFADSGGLGMFIPFFIILLSYLSTQYEKEQSTLQPALQEEPEPLIAARLAAARPLLKVP